MHCLIVANETSGGTKLTGMIRDRVDTGRRSFVVVAPLTPPDEYAPSWVVPADPGWEGSVPEAGSADALLAGDVDGFIAWIRAREAEHARRLGAGRR